MPKSIISSDVTRSLKAARDLSEENRRLAELFKKVDADSVDRLALWATHREAKSEWSTKVVAQFDSLISAAEAVEKKEAGAEAKTQQQPQKTTRTSTTLSRGSSCARSGQEDPACICTASPHGAN